MMGTVPKATRLQVKENVLVQINPALRYFAFGVRRSQVIRICFSDSVLEFELRKSQETIKSLRASLTKTAGGCVTMFRLQTFLRSETSRGRYEEAYNAQSFFRRNGSSHSRNA